MSQMISGRKLSKLEIDELVEEARKHVMTKEEREEQLVSFVWGNAPEGDCGTIETVRAHLHL